MNYFLRKVLLKLKRIYNRIIVFFYYSNKRKIIDPISPIFHLRKRHDRIAKEKMQGIQELQGYLDSMLRASNSTGCEYGDYYELYKSIRNKKPHYILECGSGISTCVIAYALKELYQEELHHCIFVTMEENQFFFDQVQNIFPLPLKTYAKFVLGERSEKRYGHALGSFYKGVPDYPYDFIFIDGPTDRKVFNDSRYEKCFNSDLIEILLTSDHSVNALLDQRIHTYWAFKRLISKAKIKYNPITRLTSIEGAKKEHLQMFSMDGGGFDRKI